jgi:hypothetical protein
MPAVNGRGGDCIILRGCALAVVAAVWDHTASQLALLSTVIP